KLINGSDQKGRTFPVDCLIDHVKRQSLAEITVGIVTGELHALWIRALPVSFHTVAATEFDRSHLCAAPRAVKHDARVLADTVEKLLEFLCGVVMPDRRHIPSHPQAYGYGCRTQFVLTFTPNQ